MIHAALANMPFLLLVPGFSSPSLHLFLGDGGNNVSAIVEAQKVHLEIALLVALEHHASTETSFEVLCGRPPATLPFELVCCVAEFNSCITCVCWRGQLGNNLKVSLLFSKPKINIVHQILFPVFMNRPTLIRYAIAKLICTIITLLLENIK